MKIKKYQMKKLYTVILLLFTLTAWSQDIPMQVVAAGVDTLKAQLQGCLSAGLWERWLTQLSKLNLYLHFNTRVPAREFVYYIG